MKKIKKSQLVNLAKEVKMTYTLKSTGGIKWGNPNMGFMCSGAPEFPCPSNRI